MNIQRSELHALSGAEHAIFTALGQTDAEYEAYAEEEEMRLASFKLPRNGSQAKVETVTISLEAYIVPDLPATT